jgi:hypothetical protein
MDDSEERALLMRDWRRVRGEAPSEPDDPASVRSRAVERAFIKLSRCDIGRGEALIWVVVCNSGIVLSSFCCCGGGGGLCSEGAHDIGRTRSRRGRLPGDPLELAWPIMRVPPSRWVQAEKKQGKNRVEWVGVGV